MPRKRELTWQPGSGDRSGRWRKKYRGRSVYLCPAPCKSDVEGYQRALAIWRTKKLEIDAEEAARPKPHQRQYEDVIREWEHVLRWSVEHGDDRHAVLAREKLADLRQRLERKVPPPIGRDDRLWSRFTWPEEVLESIAALAEGAAPPVAEVSQGSDAATVIQPSEKATDWLDGSPQRRQQEIWRDRLETQASQEEQPEAGPEGIATLLVRHLAEDQVRVRAGKLSAGRYTSKRVGLEYFRDWIGGATNPESIQGKRLLEYRGHLLEKVASQELATDTAHDRRNHLEFVASQRGASRDVDGERLPRRIRRNDSGGGGTVVVSGRSRRSGIAFAAPVAGDLCFRAHRLDLARRLHGEDNASGPPANSQCDEAARESASSVIS